MIQATLVFSPRPLETPGAGLVIQQGDRMCMFRAWRRVGNSSGSLAMLAAIRHASSYVPRQIVREHVWGEVCAQVVTLAAFMIAAVAL